MKNVFKNWLANEYFQLQSNYSETRIVWPYQISYLNPFLFGYGMSYVDKVLTIPEGGYGCSWAVYIIPEIINATRFVIKRIKCNMSTGQGDLY